MQKNQIIINREFFKHIRDGINNPLYCDVHGRKNNKVIKFGWLYSSKAFTIHIDKFIAQIKEKYENIEGSSDKEIIDNAYAIYLNKK